jgi:AcrR family transcriptional regulator
MKHHDVRKKLIEQAIKVVANEGLDKTTTKAIVGDTGINEAYIYRYFENKDDLLAQMFAALDQEVVDNVLENVIKVSQMVNASREDRCRAMHNALWNFLLGNRDKCYAYVQYYYSPYYKKYSAEDHAKRYQPIVEGFSKMIKPETNTWMLLKHIINVTLDFVIRVYEGENSDEDTVDRVFRILYYSVEPYCIEEKTE